VSSLILCSVAIWVVLIVI